MKLRLSLVIVLLAVATARAQIQVELSFKRLQYIAHEPIFATVRIANNSGRDIDLHDDSGQHWFGFEVNAGEERLLAPLSQAAAEPSLHIEAGKTVTRKVNLTSLYPVHDFGAYHVRANQLHVLHCAAPRNWAYSHVGLNGELLAHSTFLETKTRPRLRHTSDGSIAVNGGMLDVSSADSKRGPAPKLSDRPPANPAD